MRRGTDSLGADVPSEREINRLAARLDEEFWMFEKMDEERRQKENYRSRLMDEHEVPEWAYSAADGKEEKSKGFEHDASKITGKRRRKEVVYADSLSDLQWMKAVESGEDISKLSVKGKRREHHLPSEANESDSDKVGGEQKALELRGENVSMTSEGTSEDTYSLGPKRLKSEGEISDQQHNTRGGGSWNGHIPTWQTHTKRRSSYVPQSSSSDARGQNSNSRGNGWS